MSWVSVFACFLVAHMVGDYLLQTDWQARHKRGGLSDPAARRPLLTHVATYTLAFVPAFVWIATELDVGWAVVAALLVFIPHLVVDDGRVVRLYLARVKHVDGFDVGRRLVGRPVLPRALAVARGAAAGGRVNRRNAPAARAAAARRRWWSSPRRRSRWSARTRCSAWSTRASTSASRSAGQQPPPNDVAIVAIDDKTFDGAQRALAVPAHATTRG